MLARRSVLSGVVAGAFLGCANANADETNSDSVARGRAILDRAIEAAGGASALSAARVLSWSGRATVLVGRETSAVLVETTIEPFLYGRTATRSAEGGRESFQVVEVFADRASIESNGQRRTLSDAEFRYHRAQFRLLGLMRLVSLRDLEVPIEGGPVTVNGEPSPTPLMRFALGFRDPVTNHTAQLLFDEDYRLRLISSGFDNPSSAERWMVQMTAMLGTIEAGGAQWPSRIRLIQHSPTRGLIPDAHGNPVPAFDLTIEHFSTRAQL